jgi:hypothetical protein
MYKLVDLDEEVHFVQRQAESCGDLFGALTSLVHTQHLNPAALGDPRLGG